MGYKAKKSLGQHFLRSQKAVTQMVAAADMHPGDLVLEVGPGRGMLTGALLATGATVVAVEADSDMIPVLEERFAGEITSGRLVLVSGDVLDSKTQRSFLEKLLGGDAERSDKEGETFVTTNVSPLSAEYTVVANIPYYITGALFRLFLEKLPQPESLTFLVQKEVAEQVVARDGKEGVLSLSVKAFGEPRYVAKVPRESFAPPPKVDSAIVHIANISRERLGTLGSGDFFRVVKAGLSSRRKMLLGNLASKLEISRSELGKIFLSLNISLAARGEDLPVKTWIRLARGIRAARLANKNRC